MTEKKKPEIIFQPGCFDGFEGTQEELDEIIESIQGMDAEEFFANSKPIDIQSLMEEDPEFAQMLIEQLNALENEDSVETKRTLQ